ncbi:MAG TPA: DNA polymerase III subunit delta, partial [Nitrospirota bacterium]|nr:DNA polymerase III subunit delta [Nitrospirota bacterium]
MKLKTHELFEHLERKPLAPVYLFTGEEGYFMERALGKLLDRALLGAPRDFNLDVFYGKDARADEIALQASTLPMMAERRAVVLKEADRLRDLAPVKEYLKSPSDTTVFVMVAMDADRAKERTLTDAVPKNGVAVHFYHPFENQLPDYVRIIAKDSGFNIDRQASAYLIDMLGGNLALIEAELNKLFNLLGERKTVTYEDAKESVGDFGMPLVFDLIDSVAARKPAEALELL